MADNVFESEFAGKGEEGAPYHMAFLYYKHLQKLWQQMDEAYLKNDLSGWYKCIYTMYSNISFRLNEKENNEMMEKLNVIKVMITDKQNKKDITTLTSEAKMKIIALMHKYNMIFPNIKKPLGLDQIYEDYPDLKKNKGKKI